MGGLTVLSALRREMPGEQFLYLGDTARLPYGTKSPATVQRYAAQAAATLVERGIKALVVACNTASGLALKYLEQQFPDVPVYGVVLPGAEAAVAAARAGAPGRVVVLATESTIQGGAYQRALAQLAPQLEVHGRACPLWVTLAEMGPQPSELTRAILAHGVGPYVSMGACTFLLGCTHFPVFSGELQALVPDATLIDSAATTAAVVARRLNQAALAGTSAIGGGAAFLATDGAARFRQVGGHFLGESIAEVELVDL